MKKLYLIAIAIISVNSYTRLFAERIVTFTNHTAYPVALNIYYQASGHKTNQNGTATIPARGTGSMSFPDKLTFKTAFMKYTDNDKVVHNGSLTDNTIMQKYFIGGEECNGTRSQCDRNNTNCVLVCDLIQYGGFTIILDSNNNPKLIGTENSKNHRMR